MLLADLQTIGASSLDKFAIVFEKYSGLYDSQFLLDVPQEVLGCAFVKDLRQDLAADVVKVWVVEGAGQGRAVLVAHQNEWDTGFFGFRIDRMDYLIGTDVSIMDSAVRQYLQVSRKSGVQQISARVNVSDVEAAKALLRNDFILVGTKAILRNHFQGFVELPFSGVKIRPFCGADRGAVFALAGSEAEMGRFANDNRFDKCRVRQMYERWVLDHCDKNGDQVLIAEVDEKVVGFLAFTVGLPLYGAPDISNLNPGVVTHIAVDGLCRKQGLGRALLTHGLAQMRNIGAGVAFATTSLGNRASLGVFQSVGFRIITSHWEFHWWCG